MNNADYQTNRSVSDQRAANYKSRGQRRAGALRVITVAAVAVVALLSGGVPFAAATPGTGGGMLPMVDPPVFDPAKHRAPADGVPGPDPLMGDNEQKTQCNTSAVLADSQFRTAPANTVMRVDELRQFATGVGQTVAVIDSGVARNVRLPRLRPGGDYIMGGDGLEDCDHHGTLIAGIIAAQPSPNDGFRGIAPDATILSIRQTSSAFQPAKPRSGLTDAQKSSSSLSTLARAVVHAVNAGATVINLSVTACADVGSGVDISSISGALHYAYEKNVVVVASAGNTGSGTASGCASNPGYDPANPTDLRNWAGATHISLPSYFSNMVLSVGGQDLQGAPYINSMAGPWVGVAAPAMNIVSLDPSKGATGELMNAEIVKGKPVPLNGTSFSSAYISGLVALIRERFPKLSVDEVIARVKLTAHRPSRDLMNSLGYGTVDPVAALTAQLKDYRVDDPMVPPLEAPPPSPPPAPDRTPDVFAYSALGVAAVVAFVAMIIMFARNARQR